MGWLTKGPKGKADTAYPLDYFLRSIDKLNPKQRVKLTDRMGPQGQTLFKPESWCSARIPPPCGMPTASK